MVVFVDYEVVVGVVVESKFDIGVGVMYIGL